MSLDARWAIAKGICEKGLAAEVESWVQWPAPLREACEYALMSGGKRFRPVLALLMADAMGTRHEVVLPWALAVEMIHTYSLVHDDLPAMDDDDLRRGKPTVHRAFGEAMAILAGDALLTRAFGVLSEGRHTAEVLAELVRCLAGTTGGGGMVGGQVMDMTVAFENEEQVYTMQRLKTGALIRAAAEGTAIAAAATAETREGAGRFGAALGLLFQVTDDIIDREQDQDDGKNLLSHMSLDAALAERDRLAEEARSALQAFPNPQDTLDALVVRIAHRDA